MFEVVSVGTFQGAIKSCGTEQPSPKVTLRFQIDETSLSTDLAKAVSKNVWPTNAYLYGSCLQLSRPRYVAG